MKNIMHTADVQWRSRLSSLLRDGMGAAPRGKQVLEQLHASIAVNIEESLVSDSMRKLNYRFAAAEALWIIQGHNEVEILAKYNPRMRDFSDDGLILAGAYGPRLVPQFKWVVDKLLEDESTRQAVASIWTPNPEPSKDIPCTIALTFMVRNGMLHCHAFMRSSDVWLGVPYDLFSFSQVALFILAKYNSIKRFESAHAIMPGRLYLTAASSHLYAEHFDSAKAVLDASMVTNTLEPLPRGFSELSVIERLQDLQKRGRTALLT